MHHDMETLSVLQSFCEGYPLGIQYSPADTTHEGLRTWNAFQLHDVIVDLICPMALKKLMLIFPRVL